MGRSGQRINERKKKLAKMTKVPKKTAYLRPKQCILTRRLGLEMIEVGALWLRLVKESTKQKKNQPKSEQ